MPEDKQISKILSLEKGGRREKVRTRDHVVFSNMIMYPDSTSEIFVFISDELKGGLFRNHKGFWKGNLLSAPVRTLADAELDIYENHVP